MKLKVFGIFLLLLGTTFILYSFQNKESKAMLSKQVNTPMQAPQKRFITSTTNPQQNHIKQVKVRKKPLAKNSSQNKTELETKIYRLTELSKCYESETCNFPKSDPKSYYFAVGKNLKKALFELQGYVDENQLQSDEISKTAREYLRNDDGHVKEAALHLLATQEVNQQNLESILTDVVQFHDAKLIPHALLELQRYMNTSYESKIHQILSSVLQTGAPSVSEEIAKGILPFIQPSSLEYYEQALKRLDPKSSSYHTLQALIKEYGRRETAA